MPFFYWHKLCQWSKKDGTVCAKPLFCCKQVNPWLCQGWQWNCKHVFLMLFRLFFFDSWFSVLFISPCRKPRRAQLFLKKITAYKWALAVNPVVLNFAFELSQTFLEKKNGICKPITSSQNSGVPSYTPPPNRGGSWKKFVAFGCEKYIDKNENGYLSFHSV